MSAMPANEDDPLTLLYVPCGSEAEALALGHALVDAGLIACANLHVHPLDLPLGGAGGG